MYSNFFLWCSGTSQKILEGCSEESRIRQEQMGAHVFFTALLALCSSYFALTYAFDETGIILVFASLWGISIFLLDRTLIVSPVLTHHKSTLMGKQSARHDDKHLSTAWFSLVIRLALAVLLGLFIATPFELKIFSPEIEAHLHKGNQKTHIDNLDKLITDGETKIKNFEGKRNSLELELINKPTDQEKHLKDELDKLRTQIEKKEHLRDGEYKGTSGSKIKGAGDRFKRISEELYDLNTVVLGFNNKLLWLSAARQEKIDATTLKHNNEINQAKLYVEEWTKERNELIASLGNISDNGSYQAHKGTDSLLTRMNALMELQENDTKISNICLIVFLIFTLFETIPILAKFFFKGSDYDLKIVKNKRDAEEITYKSFAESHEREEESRVKIDDARTHADVKLKLNEALRNTPFSNDLINIMKNEWDDIFSKWREWRKSKHDDNIAHLEEKFSTIFEKIKENITVEPEPEPLVWDFRLIPEEMAKNIRTIIYSTLPLLVLALLIYQFSITSNPLASSVGATLSYVVAVILLVLAYKRRSSRKNKTIIIQNNISP